jgi:hypothetical protein
MWMDLGKLIRESTPDKTGKTLPRDLASGSYEFRDLTNTGIGTLFEGKVIYDKTYGHVIYGCGTCCGYNAAELHFNPIFVLLPGPPVDDGVWGWSVCDQQYEDVSTDFWDNWGSVNTSIVTVDSYGAHTGQSIGSTTTDTFGYLESTAHYPICPAKEFSPGGGANVGDPAQLLVIGDTTTNPTNCPNTKLRILAYQIQDANGNDVTTDVQTKEQFASKSSNTCNTTITTSETCGGTPGGIIHDSLTVGCNSVDNGCGYTYTKQQWVWCNGATNTVIGTVGDLVVHDNAISVGGSYTSIQGNVIKP